MDLLSRRLLGRLAFLHSENTEGPAKHDDELHRQDASLEGDLEYLRDPNHF